MSFISIFWTFKSISCNQKTLDLKFLFSYIKFNNFFLGYFFSLRRCAEAVEVQIPKLMGVIPDLITNLKNTHLNLPSTEINSAYKREKALFFFWLNLYYNNCISTTTKAKASRETLKSEKPLNPICNRICCLFLQCSLK